MVTLFLSVLLACSTPEAVPDQNDEGITKTRRALAPSLGNPPPLPPTEHWVHSDSEMGNKVRRKTWFRDRHRAPPDVDWKALERANGLAQIAKRNAVGGRRPVDEFGAKWVERGSENQAGRMHVAALSADGQSLFAGSSLGGVWRGTLQGDDWEPLGDNLYGGAHWLALFAPEGSGPEVILAATDGGLVHRSVDDGLTWTVPDGVGALWRVRRLTRLRDGSETGLMVTRPANSDRSEILRSTDGGATWNTVLDLGSFQGDLWASRTGSSDVYALAADGLHHSADGGATFARVGDLPDDGAAVTELAGVETDSRLYAVTQRSDGAATLWRSDDLGTTWILGQTIEDYWGVLTASSTDSDLVAWGGVEVHRSRDGGFNFDVVNGWGEYYIDPVGRLHADIMGIDVIPGDGGAETWYIGTDGGMYESTDGLATVSNLSLRGLRVGQYYDTLTSSTNPSQVAAGSQDQGYQVTNGIAQSSDRWDFDQILSGDYGHLTSSDGSHDWVYSVYPTFVLAQEGGDEPVLHDVPFPNDPRIAWLPLVVADPETKRSFFFCGSQLHHYTYDRQADQWDVELWSDQSFSGDGYEFLSGLTFSPVDSNRAYAVTSYGRLFWSDDKGRSWTESSDLAPSGHYFYGTALTASLTDVDTAWVAGSGYDGPAVYRTRTGGKNWQPFGEGLPETLVYSLCEAPDGSGVLFAGSETTAWRRDKGADAEWTDLTGAEAPATTYWSCEGLQHENTIRFGTYGRGIWDYQMDPDGLGCFPPVDRDGDGVLCDLDCDDANAEVFPGNTEKNCDGVDNDCDPRNEVPDAVCAEQRQCGCATGTGPAPWALVVLALCLGRPPRRSEERNQ